MYAYAIAYKDKDGYIEYIKSPDTNSYMLYDNNQTAGKAVSFLKDYYKTLMKPTTIIKRKFFKKEIVHEYMSDIVRDHYNLILKTIHIKKVSIL